MVPNSVLRAMLVIELGPICSGTVVGDALNIGPRRATADPVAPAAMSITRGLGFELADLELVWLDERWSRPCRRLRTWCH